MSSLHYLPLTEQERRQMLSEIGAASAEDLFKDVPAAVRFQGEMQLPPPLSEMEALQHLGQMAARNKNLKDYSSFLGAGVYDHYVPAVVSHITGRSEFYTSYTPYQAEISQGMLQAIFEYQTLICQLTGMDVANASMYDGATALAEGAVLACGATRRSKLLVSSTVNPFYRQVLQNYFNTRDLTLEEVPFAQGQMDRARLEEALDDQVAALVVQQPNFFGILEDLNQVAEMLHAKKALLVVSVDPISLPLVKTPAEYGADIVTGEGQGLGSAPSFGGPLLGFFAVKEEFARRAPGRIAGETVDKDGKRGFVLTLQTREQHIRRERATSNICSNQALVALAAAVHMAALGPAGLREVAELSLQKAAYTREKISALEGFEPAFPGIHFKEFAVKLPGEAKRLNSYLLERKIIGGLDLEPHYPQLGRGALFCVTETKTRAQIDALIEALEGWK